MMAAYAITEAGACSDKYLASLYGVPTRTLNQAVRRNRGRFPADFMLNISVDEWAALRSQFVILDSEHRAIMGAVVLNRFTADIDKKP